MLMLTRPNVEPPSGWKFKDPDTGYISTGNDFHDLVAKARKHRGWNNLAVAEDFEQQVINFLCENNPDEICMESTPGVKRQRHFMPTFSQMVKGSQLLFDTWRRRGQNVVVQAEAERRAALCVNCPNNTSEKECMTCNGMLDVVRGWTGHKKTSLDDRLWSCKICGCFSKLAVHIDATTLKKLQGPDDYPDEITGLDKKPMKCWRSEL